MLNSNGGFKKPLRLKDAKLWCGIIDSSVAYLSSLKTTDGVPLMNTRRRTFVHGFIIAATSVKKLAMELLTLVKDPFLYLLTYKLCQDHLELLFSCIRSKNGWSNNPTIPQFKSALRRILIHAELIVSGNANCMFFEMDTSPSLFSLKWTKNRSSLSEETDFDHDDIPPVIEFHSHSHSIYKKNMLAYIGGYICRSLAKTLSCDTCLDSLHDPEMANNDACTLIKVKDNGGLLYPSADVLTVLSVTESVFKEFCINCLMPQSSKSLRSKMKVKIMEILFDKDVFDSLAVHDFDTHCPTQDMHSSQLCKAIAHKYIDMRLFRHQQTLTDNKLRKGKHI